MDRAGISLHANAAEGDVEACLVVLAERQKKASAHLKVVVARFQAHGLATPGDA